jgi:hypothetical protein
MKTSSAKAKGRDLQNKVRDLIIASFPVNEFDVKSTPMGCSGEDIWLSDAARKLFPFSVECKNQERLNLWASWEQAVSNTTAGNTLLVVKRNRQKPLAVVSIDVFFELLRKSNEV